MAWLRSGSACGIPRRRRNIPDFEPPFLSHLLRTRLLTRAREREPGRVEKEVRAEDGRMCGRTEARKSERADYTYLDEMKQYPHLVVLPAAARAWGQRAAGSCCILDTILFYFSHVTKLEAGFPRSFVPHLPGPFFFRRKLPMAFELCSCLTSVVTTKLVRSAEEYHSLKPAGIIQL